MTMGTIAIGCGYFHCTEKITKKKLFSLTTTPRRPGAECAHVTVFWPMKSCHQMLPRDRSENNQKSYFHCTVKKTKKNIFTVQ